MAEVFSESLDFSKVKQRAVQSRSYRVKLPPSNATSFAPSQTIEFNLPANQAGTYWNSNQCYLKFKFTNTSVNNAAAAVQCDFDRAGAYGLVRRMQVSTAGAMISDLDRFNVLANAMIDTDASQEWKTSTGHTLVGTTGLMRGAAVDTGSPSRIYCLPLILSPLSQTSPHRLIPLFSLSALQLRFTLEEAAVALRVPALTDVPGYAISDVELVYQATELSPGAQGMIDQMTGGRYDILATSYMHSSATLQAQNSGLTANLGFSVSSLERVIICHRKNITVSGTNQKTGYSLGSRCAAGLQQYSLLINSEQFPSRPIVRGDLHGAEPLAEMLLASHSLVDFNSGSGLNNGFTAGGITGGEAIGFSRSVNLKPNAGAILEDPFATDDPAGTSAGAAGDAIATAATASDVGSFLCAVELESGVSDGKSSHIYSGVSTLASTVQYVATYSGAVNADITVDFFGNYTILMSLAMNGTGVWSISV
jgi:hypothetical protein